ncbi:MAG: response regulator [Ignavibacteriae bacterium]|nr:MAG: response regulator [Ignavibacteriota bacterium]
MSKQDLKELFKRYKSDSQIYHDLLNFRVREILIVTTLYDAYILEQEESLTEQIFGEYYSLSLTSAPRITSAASGQEAMEYIRARRFDMIILTMRIPDTSPFELSQEIKSFDNDLNVFLLLYDNNDLKQLGDKRDHIAGIDRVFVWNRDSKVFLAMIKYLEDKKNVDNDTAVGLVRVILLVENSVKYYSRYLPVLYNEILIQTRRLIEDEHREETKKILRMNARTKVLMALNFEEAVEIIEKYNEYLLCVISDVKYPMNGESNPRAGIELIKYVKDRYHDMPTVLQSSDMENEKKALEHNSFFINKNSPHLSSDLRDFIYNNLGFGDFIFRVNNRDEIERASSMKDFRKLLGKIPYESLFFHASRNHFSAWLMARGEIRIAKKIQPVKATDFKNAQELRSYLIEVFENIDNQSIKGKIIEYDETLLEKDSFILRLAEGSLGGKGRGIAFMNAILQNIDVKEKFPDVDIKIPRSAVIGTNEFDLFLEKNKLNEIVNIVTDYEAIKKNFLDGKLSKQLKEELRAYLMHVSKPVAIRSSSLFEDSVSESFSGVYQTFLLPNNESTISERLKHLEDAVKLVYASVFAPSARSYFEAISYKVEEEKMAVLIQEVVGNSYGNYYYPDFSGVAQSYNYYPIAYMKPEDGIGIVSVGLGKYVIDGEKSCRFSPKHPRLEIITPDEQLKNTQTYFYAIDMKSSDVNLSKGEDITLAKLKIGEAQKHGRLNYIASSWDSENNRIKVGIDKSGALIINFAYILKYDAFPLARILTYILNLVKISMGTPVEIEFAVDMGNDENNHSYKNIMNVKPKKPAFHILQIKPLIREIKHYNINVEEIEKDELFLFTERGMGNGRLDDICDLIYCDPDKFDKSKTVEMAEELEKLNKLMVEKKRKYILIGPGRWGSRDRWLGIPVIWAQISNAKIIIEAGLKNFHVDASLGSHFFHNITSMNIGYFNVPYNSGDNFIDWNWLNEQKEKSCSEYFVHVCFEKPLVVLMDGRKGVSVIYKSV